MVKHFSRDLRRQNGDIRFLIPNIYRMFLMLGMMELVECIFQMYWNAMNISCWVVETEQSHDSDEGVKIVSESR